TAPAAMSRHGQTRSLISSGRPRNSVSTALLTSSVVRTMPMQPTSRHHSSGLQPRATAAARTSAATKKWTKKLEWPRTPSFQPRKATRNLPRQVSFLRGGGSARSARSDWGCTRAIASWRARGTSAPPPPLPSPAAWRTSRPVSPHERDECVVLQRVGEFAAEQEVAADYARAAHHLALAGQREGVGRVDDHDPDHRPR